MYQVSIKKKLRFIQGWLEHIKDMRQKHVDYHVNNGAVLYISKAYMMFKMRKRLTKLLYWNHYAKSIIIQRYYRGYIIRKKVTPRLLNYKHSLLTENQNATIIQKIVRGYYGRKRFTYLVYKKEQEQDLKYQEKLLRLATVSNGLMNVEWVVLTYYSVCFRAKG